MAILSHLVFLLAVFSIASYSMASHPKLVLNKRDVQAMVSARDSLPAFQKAYKKVQLSVDDVMERPIEVPLPADAGGGYTHEQHKNYNTIRNAGLMFQITGEKKYANHARDILLAYAKFYPSLGNHPKRKEQAPGRLFWQSLNESVWLVYSIQGYDAILPALEQQERDTIEKNVFVPMATFLSEGSPKTFNKVHNHGTWATAAVGMTGYVLGKYDMVEKALLGLDRSGNAGFLKQLDRLFSPDGYYTEGPYYQRYALMPFFLFAKAIQYNDPQRKIFEYRDKILIKALYATIQQTYANYFFPINDALKDKGLDTVELIHGVSIGFGLTKDPALLSIAKVQHTISVSGDGVKVAEGLEQGIEKGFPFESMQLSDGVEGKQGALSILRSGKEEGHMALVVKNTAQGLGHGHFDKLSWLLYDNGSEVVTDYGAARFLNIEAKYGGHYLPENKAYAKQTVAHNTLVVDEVSHSQGKYKAAKDLHPEILLFHTSDEIDVSSARMMHSYNDVSFVRTMAMIKNGVFEHPLVLDILRVASDSSHQYDLPLYYQGHIVNVTFPVKANSQMLKPLGEKSGYQFLWDRAIGRPKTPGLSQVTWLLNNRFYTLNMLAHRDSLVHFVELGANDPNFNLRRESGIIHRVKAVSDHVFVSALEGHGEYNPALEFTQNSYSNIAKLAHRAKKGKDYIEIKTRDGKTLGLALSYDKRLNKSHKIKVDGKTIRWKGFYHLFGS